MFSTGVEEHNNVEWVCFKKKSVCEGWSILKMCVIYNVHCVLQCDIPVCFLCHGNMPSGRCCFLQILDTQLRVAIVFNQFSLKNRNNIASKYGVCPLKM